MKNNETFNYTYSAKEQEEIRTIRKKYVETEEEDKMALIRRLDASVTKKASTLSLMSGIIGALILGFGMSLIMSELGGTLFSQKETAVVIGVAVGIIGIALVSVAYPIFNHIVKKERKKIAPEIIRLTDELMK